MPELNDVCNVFKAGIIQWMKKCFTTDAHTIFNKRDLAPFFHSVQKLKM